MRKFTSGGSSTFWRTWTNTLQSSLLTAVALLGATSLAYGQCPPEEPPLAPYLVDWEGFAIGASATLPNCWTMAPVSISTSYPGWRIEDGATASGSTGPGVDITLGTTAGKYIYLETSGSVNGTMSSFSSPDISLDNLGSLRELTFFYHMYGATMGTLTVDVFNGTSYDTVFTIAGQQHTSLTAPWSKATVSLAAYTGTVHFRFHGSRGTSFTGDMAIDDIFIADPPACNEPTNLSLLSVGISSAQITWTPGDAAATSWNVEYGPSGFTLGTGTVVTVSSSTTTLTGLSSYTDYTVYVNEQCVGSALISNQSIPLAFSTPIVPDWSENMDTWTSSVYSSGWSEADGAIGSANTTFTSTTSGGWFLDGMANNGTTGAMRNFASRSSTTLYSEWLITPSIDLGTSNNYELRFAAALTTNSATTPSTMGLDDSLCVVISTDNGTTWNRSGILRTFTDADAVSNTPSYYTVSLAGYSGTVKLGFYHQSKTFISGVETGSYDFFIDEVTVRTPPSCPDPIGLTSSGVTNVAATLSWISTGTAFDVEYGIQGFTPGTGTILSVTDTFGTVSGLMGNTTYDFYVRQDCGAQGFSPDFGPLAVKTQCDPASIWFEDFEAYPSSTTSLPNCWSKIGGNGSFFVTTTTPSSGVRSFYIYGTTTATPTGAITPVNNLGAGTHRLVFQGRSGSTTYNKSLRIGYVTDLSDATTFVKLDSAEISGTTMSEYTVNVSAGAPSGAIFAVQLSQNASGSIYIDDVSWEAIPTCPSPIDLTANVASATSAMATWNPGASETMWDVHVVPTGSAAPVGLGTVVTDTFYTATGLSVPNVYDVYVRAICGAGDTSLARMTNVAVDYCASNATSTSWSNIASVSVGTDTIASNVQPACVTYTDNRALAPFQLQYAVQSPMSVFYGSCTTNFNSYVKVFIDFNGDLTFDPVTELVAEGSVSAASAFTGNSNMPASGNIGNAVMRVVLRESGTTTTVEPCGTYTWGETQDFMVNLIAPPACVPPVSNTTVSTYGSQATIAWSSAETSFEIEYDSTGFAQGASNNAVLTVSNDTMATITGLSPQTTYDYYIRTNCSGAYSPWVGPFSFTTTVICPAPSNFVGIIGTTWASLSWQSNGLNTDFFYILDSAGVTPSTGTILMGTGDSAYVGGLYPNTTYTAFVANNCGSDTSSWSPAITFTTLCEALVAPYVESFTSFNAGIVGPSLTNCWYIGRGSSSASFRWETEDASGFNENSTATGPFWDNSSFGTAGGKYIYLETSSGTTGDSAFLQSPLVNIDNLSNPGAIFYYHRYGATMGDMRVDIFNGSSWDIGVWSITGGQQQTAGSDPWILASIPLNAYSGDIAVRFVGFRGTSFNGDMSIDDFSIQDASPCAFPTATFATALSSTEAQLSWTAGNASATAWLMGYINTDDTAATMNYSMVSNDTVNLSGLMPFTNYQFMVAEMCTSGDTSWFTPSFAFTTMRAPYWLYDFAVSPTTNGWNEQDGRLTDSTTFTSFTASNWITDGMSNNGTTGAYRVNFPTSSTANYEWIISPSIDLGTSMNFELRWQSALTTSSGILNGALSPDDSIMVVISTDNGTTWSRSGIIAVQDMNSGLTANPSMNTASLATYSGVVKVGFYMKSNATSTAAADYFIDNVEIREIPSCADIVGSTAYNSNVTGTTATISWSANGANNFDVEYGIAGYTPGSGTMTSTTDTFMVLTGLSAATSYNAYVRQNCGFVDLGAWSYPTSFLTSIIPNWLEGFDLTYTSTLGWSEGKGRIADTTVFTSTSSNWGNDLFANAVGGSNAAWMNVFSTLKFEWMFSPTIEMPTNGSVYELTFDLGMTEFANNQLEAIMGVDDTVMVVISTDNGVTWSRSNVVYTVHQGNKPAGVLSWPVSISLMGYTGNIKIGFYAESTVFNEDIDVFIDNVAITENCNLAPVTISGVNFVSSPAQYNVQFSTSAGDLFVLQTREVGTDTWFTPKSWTAALTSQNFIARLPGVDNEVRLGARVNGSFYYSCPVSFAADCKPMTVSAIQLVAPFCAGDSAVLKAIDAGGFKAKTYLWNTGETTRFIYGQQGQTYQVVVTDAAGCSDSASVTVSNVGSPYTPGNFALAKPNQVTFVGSWTAPSLGSGVSLIGYRMQYRQVNVGASWRQTALTTATSSTVNFTGSCDPSANYEFAVFARVNDNGTVYNTPVTCTERRFYNGSGGCTTAKSDITNASNPMLNGITVYPNPTQGIVNVGLNNEAATLELLDMNGKLLFSQEFDGAAEASINLADLASGVYMLNVTTATGIYQERVVKN